MEASDKDSEIPEEAYGLLKRVAKEWSGIENAEKMEIIKKKGSMTNKVYECLWTWKGSHNEKNKRVLLRVYGEGAKLLFDRDTEIITFERMSHLGYGPRLLGRFRNGRLEEFLNAKTLTASDLHDRDISKKVAVKLNEFHCLDIPGLPQPYIWERLRDWLEKSRKLCRPEVAEEFQFDRLEEEISKLKHMISRPGQDVGFCHNDLQYGNIMISEIDASITLIDYEYACYNVIAFDIANYFCEMMADYHSEFPHLLDKTKYPDQSKRREFVKWYLECSGKADSLDIEKMMNDVDDYVLASHIHWGLWGILSALVAEIDFDYLGYARERFKLYYEHFS